MGWEVQDGCKGFSPSNWKYMLSKQGGSGGRLNRIEMLARHEEGKRGVPSNQAVEGNSIKDSGEHREAQGR